MKQPIKKGRVLFLPAGMNGTELEEWMDENKIQGLQPKQSQRQIRYSRDKKKKFDLRTKN